MLLLDANRARRRSRGRELMALAAARHERCSPHDDMNKLPVLFTVSLAACASTPGAQPHDMSAAQHEAMAQRAEQGAALQQSQYDPSARASSTICNSRSGTCWTSTSNPTAQHLEEAERYRKMAADHRAASQTLRDAEAQACVGLTEEDRDRSPFTHREDIASVDPLYANLSSGKGPNARLEGATVTFRAVPGMTAQWLQRVVDCHLARNAAMGHEAAEMPDCPLVPKNVSAQVTATSTGFAVSVRSDDPATANEVLRRARLLTAR
jgi:hypothetical protein